MKAKMIPRNFDDGEVASFTLLNGRGKQIAERDIRITSDMNEIVIEAEADYDRSDMTSGFELNWTNGNHLQDPSRVKLLRLGFDGSDRSLSAAVSAMILSMPT